MRSGYLYWQRDPYAEVATYSLRHYGDDAPRRGRVEVYVQFAMRDDGSRVWRIREDEREASARTYSSRPAAENAAYDWAQAQEESE